MAILKDIWSIMSSQEPLIQRRGVIERISYHPAPSPDSGVDYWAVLFKGEPDPILLRLHKSVGDASRIALALSQQGDEAVFSGHLLSPTPGREWPAKLRVYQLQNDTLAARLPRLAQ